MYGAIKYNDKFKSFKTVELEGNVFVPNENQFCWI